MDMERLGRAVLSKPAILIYEALILAVLIYFILSLTKRRKQRKLANMALQKQEQRKALEESLVNRKRR